MPRSVLRLPRDHRDPRHDPRPCAWRNQVLELRLERGGHHRRAEALPGHDLQGRSGGTQPGRRQVGHCREQQARRPRGALPGPRPVRRDAQRPLHNRRRCRHQPDGHGARAAGDQARGRAGGPVGRSLSSHGLRGVHGHQGHRPGPLGQRRPQWPRRGGAGRGQGGVQPVAPPPRRGRADLHHRYRCRQGQPRGHRVRRAGSVTGRDLRPAGRHLCSLRAGRDHQR